MRNKATINDVARLAEVSVATVSYVLNKNQKKSISAETTKRVLDAAKQLNYVSNSAAKTLQSSRTNCIGVVLYQSLTLPRHAQILQGMIDALQEQSYSILFCSSEITQNEYPEYLSAYFSHKIDGVVYLGADASALDPEIESVIVEQRIPFVVCDCETNRNISSVVIDYFKGAYDMTNFLIESRGVKKIFFVRPDVNNRQEREREQGVRRAVYEHPDVQLDTTLIDYNDLDKFFFNFSSQLKSKTDEFDGVSGLWRGIQCS
jgi:DNA-binding LacI/PurR family transcriptional regulator